MKFHKAAAIPAKADWEKQEEFKKMLEPEIARAKAGESVLLFMDGAHFVQAAFLGCLWCFARIFIRSPSRRKRWNVLGVQCDHGSVDDRGERRLHHGDDGLRDITKTIRAIYGSIDRDRVGQREIPTRQADGGVGEGIGNHASVFAQLFAEPELDRTAVEVREEKCLYNIYYETFGKFTAGINDCLAPVETDYKSELATLMQPDFQDMKNVCLWAL